MNTQTTIKEKVQALIAATNGQIKYFIFDDLSTINGDSKAEFPLLLLKPTQMESKDRTLENFTGDIELFLFDQELSDSEEHWTTKWDELEAILVPLLRSWFQDVPTYVLESQVKLNCGHFQQNAKLIGVRATFKLRLFYGC